MRETIQIKSSRIHVIDRGTYEEYWDQDVQRSGLRFRTLGRLPVAQGLFYDEERRSKEFLVTTDGTTYLLLWGPIVRLHQAFFDCFAARQRAETGG